MDGLAKVVKSMFSNPPSGIDNNTMGGGGGNPLTQRSREHAGCQNGDRDRGKNLNLCFLKFVKCFRVLWNWRRRIRTKILWLIQPVSGVAALEVVLTLPIICMLIFSSIEILKMHIAQTAINAICAEATFVTIAQGSKGGPALIQKIDAIIEKYRPKFIPQQIGGYAVIRYHFETYNSLEQMCGTAPYGGTCIHYPSYEKEPDYTARNHASPSYAGSSNPRFIPSGDSHWHYSDLYSYVYTNSHLAGSGLPSGCTFVLTFCCNYPFSSSFIKGLLSSGVNTRKCTVNAVGNVGATSTFKKADLYLLWARGVGIVN